jgi:signal transduction histidine kinase
VRTVVETLQWQAEAKRQTIAFAEPAAGAGRLNGDAARLYQVLANLLSNAIKFSPPGETIGISLVRDAGNVTMTVRDRGPGLAADDISALFAPFDRLAGNTHIAESSHGMGLLSAQEIVQQHGGKISVVSKPGDGAAFTVSLPV